MRVRWASCAVVQLLLLVYLSKTHESQLAVNEAALTLKYAHVSDWVTFSHNADIRFPCQHGLPLRVAYFTRHTGTLWDWVAVATHLDVPWTRVNPGLFQTYGMNASEAERNWRSVGHMLCHMADILVFSDTVPDARPLLQGGCETPIILQVTNRFDYGIQLADRAAYLEVIAAATRRPTVWWVPNNPYEELHLAKHGITLPAERTLMLRPVGACLLPDPEPKAGSGTASGSGTAASGATPVTGGPGSGTASGNGGGPEGHDRRVALVLPAHGRHLEATFILPWIMSHGLTGQVQEYRTHYGGPGVLARHRGVITVPYQTSVMKMYEGLSAGAVFVIPSPQLFATLLRQLDGGHMNFCCRELFTDRPADWTRYMDWYHPDFMDAHVMYDSVEELRRFITNRAWSARLVSKKRLAGRRAMERSRRRTLDGFTALFANITVHLCSRYAGASASSDAAAGAAPATNR